MSESKIHAPAVSVALHGVAFGALGEDAQPVTISTPLPGWSPGGLLTVGAGFARPADTAAYAPGDLVANSAAAGSVAPVEFIGAARAVGEAIRIERVRLRKSSPSLTEAVFRVHLFDMAPTVGVGDNAAFSASGVLALSDIDGHLGFIDVTMVSAAAIGAKGVGIPAIGAGMTCKTEGGMGHETSVWALIEARAAYAPVSGETFYLTLEGARS